MKTQSIQFVLAAASLVGIVAFAVALALDGFVFSSFAIATVSLIALSLVRDYAPKARRFQPQAAAQPSYRSGLRLAA